jgi:HD-GYP domain-containing protein (c-di-GMP phosphodiesterase class II)
MLVDQEYPKAYTDYIELIERLRDIFVKIALNHFLKADCMKGMVEKLYNEYRPFTEFVISVDNGEYGAAKNAVDTAVLSVAIANRMNFSISQTYKLIEAALLHDVGMFYIPKEILDKENSLSNDEYKYILFHPLQSYKVITKELDCFDGVAQISMQHHESWNGEGYPKRLSKTEIELEARIVAVADAFVAMVSKRPYRAALLGYDAMKNLMANNMARFDPDIVKLFVQIMGLYPIGSRVELTNNATAQVVEHWAEASLLKPRVRMLTKSSGELCTSEEIVNLSQEKGIFIKKALAPSFVFC